MSSHDQDIELTRIDRTHDEEGRVHQSMTEADLATGGAAGAPALAANAEDVIHRTTAMKDKEVFSSRIVWLCAGFLLLYVVSFITESLIQGIFRQCYISHTLLLNHQRDDITLTNIWFPCNVQGAEVSIGGWVVSL